MEPSTSHWLKSLARNWRTPHWGWGLLATIVLVVVGTGLLVGSHVYRQQQAIREIEALGGRVRVVKWGPDRLRKHVGDKWMKVFDDVDEIDFYDTQVTDAGLEHLKSLTNLESLDLGGTQQVTDAGIAGLERALPELWVDR